MLMIVPVASCPCAAFTAWPVAYAPPSGSNGATTSRTSAPRRCEHVGQHVVAAYKDAVRLDGGRRVAVTEVPGKARQGDLGRAADFEQVLALLQ